MLQIPPLPTWDSLHPLIIHFPIVLLLLCPLFILISTILRPGRGRPYMIAALVVLLLGTVSLFVSIETGEAAAELADRTDAMSAVLKSHQELAADTRNIFTVLSGILLVIFALPLALRRRDSRLFSTVLPLTFLALYSVGALLLINTAHAGGRLVHEFGVHALIPATGVPAPPQEARMEK